jgi:hypothetical protein
MIAKFRGSRIFIHHHSFFYLNSPSVSAILDRRVHNSYRIVRKGESMRRHKTAAGKPTVTSKSKNI